MASTQVTEQTSWDQVGDEAVNHLRELLRRDTRNPPGNEIRAAEYLRSVLDREGIERAWPNDVILELDVTVGDKLRSRRSQRPQLHVDLGLPAFSV